MNGNEQIKLTATALNNGVASGMFAALGNAHSWGPALLYLAFGIAALLAARRYVGRVQ
jgi:threonine/homoserine/homoserine lactone efflux protein